MQVETLLRDIENRDLVLPEFQRDFVWNKEDVKKFIQSVYKNYPTGSLLIWKTLKPPKLRVQQKDTENIYTRVLLDGQQRLTTLYLFVKGKTPPYYQNMLKQFNLYYNIETEELRYYQKTLMQNKKEWISLIGFFQHESAAVFIDKSEYRDYYFKYLSHLTKLENIIRYEYFVDEEKLGKITEIKEIVKIFNLVNKQGRTLTEEDLALAYVCSFWPDIKDLFRKELNLYKHKGFKFNFNFLIECVNAVATGHAKFDTFYSMPEDEIKQSWEKVKKVVPYLINILHNKAYINSTAVYELKSSAPLVPLIVYLSNNDSEFENEKVLRKFLYWFYNSMMWGRYTRRGKSSPLEQDVVTITKENTPESLIQNFEREVRYFDVKTENLEGAPVTSPFFNMAFIVAKSKGAVDWFNGNNLHTQLMGAAYTLNRHHIFPKAVLRNKGYYREKSKQKLVHEIANRAFLTEVANKKIRSSKPKDYLQKVVMRYPKALEQQFVTEKKELWKVENFEDFLRSRRSKIANEINTFMQALVDEVPKFDVEELIKQDESYNLELKSTFTWNIKEDKVDKQVKFATLKTVLGFMNSNGGTIVIGVDDNHDIIGLNFDYTANWKGNKDGVLMDIRNSIEQLIGVSNYNKYISVDFVNVKDKEVCIIKVEKSLDPIFHKKDNKKILYVRLDNKTEPLSDPEEIHQYIKENWQ